MRFFATTFTRCHVDAVSLIQARSHVRSPLFRLRQPRPTVPCKLSLLKFVNLSLSLDLSIRRIARYVFRCAEFCDKKETEVKRNSFARTVTFVRSDVGKDNARSAGYLCSISINYRVRRSIRRLTRTKRIFPPALQLIRDVGLRFSTEILFRTRSRPLRLHSASFLFVLRSLKISRYFFPRIPFVSIGQTQSQLLCNA